MKKFLITLILINLLISTNSALASIETANNSSIFRGDTFVEDKLVFFSESSSVELTNNSGTLSFKNSDNNAIMQINGKVKILNNSISQNGYILVSDDQGLASWVEVTDLSSINLDFNLGGDTRDTPSIIGNNDEQDFAIETNNRNRIIISKEGNIGIGTDTPQAGLDVNGNIASNSIKSDGPIAIEGNIAINRASNSGSSIIDFDRTLGSNEADIGFLANSDDFTINLATDNLAINSASDQIIANSIIEFDSDSIELPGGTVTVSDIENFGQNSKGCTVREAASSSTSHTYGKGSVASCEEGETMILGVCSVSFSDLPCSNSQINNTNSFECIAADTCNERVRAKVLCCRF